MRLMVIKAYEELLEIRKRVCIRLVAILIYLGLVRLGFVDGIAPSFLGGYSVSITIQPTSVSDGKHTSLLCSGFLLS